MLLVKKVTELLACDGTPSLGYDMEGMFLMVRGIAHNKFVASKVNNERKLPGHRCVCITWNCSKSAVQRVMLLLHIVLLPNLLEAILLL